MAAVTQPTCDCADSVILTVGILNTENGRTGAIVMPMATVTPSTSETACFGVVEAFITHAMSSLLPLLSVDAAVVFLEARPMTAGAKIPYREDYDPTDHVGTDSSPAVQSQVSLLGVYYSDGSVPTPHNRMSVGKEFIPFMAETRLTEDNIAAGFVTTLETFLTTVGNGISGPITGITYYRCCAARHTPGQSCPPATAAFGRTLIATQRRRLRR